MDPVNTYNNITSTIGANQYSQVTSINKDTDNNSSRQYTPQGSQSENGEIIDIKHNEITILLDDDTKITAKIFNSSDLNIGQHVKFKVTDTPSGLVIDQIAVKEDNSQNSFVQKALELAGVPLTEKNIQIANELIDNNMPIDKQTIQDIMRQSYLNKSVSIGTLVLMKKNNIPISQTNATQFENYKNYEHRIIKELDTITDNIPSLLDSFVEEGKDVNQIRAFNKELVNILVNVGSYNPKEKASALMAKNDEALRLAIGIERDNEQNISKEKFGLERNLLGNNKILEDDSTEAVLNSDKNRTVADNLGTNDNNSRLTKDDLKKMLDSSSIKNVNVLKEKIRDLVNSKKNANVNTNNLDEKSVSSKDIALNSEEVKNQEIKNLGEKTQFRDSNLESQNTGVKKLNEQEYRPNFRNTSVNRSSNLLYTDDALDATNMSKTYVDNPSVATAYLYPEAQKELYNVLKSFTSNEELLENVKNKTASLREVAAEILECFEEADEIDYYKVEQMNLKEATADSNINLAKDIFKSPVVQNILDKYSYMQKDNSELASFMNNFNRAQLTSKLRDIPGTDSLIKRVWKGDIATDEFLEELSKAIEDAPEKTVKSLLTSSQYKSIIKESLMNKWTISPNELTKDNIVEKTYHAIYEQIEHLEQFIANNNLEDVKQLKYEFEGTKNNMDFMNTLNEMLTYVQLPLKLRNQNVHSDLYVMTNKKKLSKDNANINVLLHLDMEYLGTMDININLVGNNIKAKFNVTDEDTKDLLSINMEELEFALLEKGFLLNSDVEMSDRTVDIINDFIEKDSPSTSIKRYTFDVRT